MCGFRKLARGHVWVIAVLWFGCNPPKADYVHDYYPLVYQGEIAFYEGDYQAAYTLFKKAIKGRYPLNLPPYYELDKLAKSATILKKEKEAFEYVDQLIDRGYELSYFTNDSLYSNLWHSSKWNNLVTAYPQKRDRYLSSVNYALRKEIIDMKTNDQLYRSRPDANQYRREQWKIDSINEAKLIDIFETVGYPNIDKIGHQSVDGYFQLDIGTMLLHTDDSIRVAYFIPKIKSFVEQGECSPFTLAKLIDQYHIFNDGYQFYGTLQRAGSPGVISDLKYPEKVDSLRKSIGLPTLRMEQERDSLLQLIYKFE